MPPKILLSHITHTHEPAQPNMATPKPRPDLFHDNPRLVSKKCRTSTPTLRPPKPPMKSSKSMRRQRGFYEHHRNPSRQNHSAMELDPNDLDITQTSLNLDSSFEGIHEEIHEGSFLHGLNNQFQDSDDESKAQSCRLFTMFDVIGKIGSGDFADVFEARSLDDGLHYAIKRTSIPFTSHSDRLRKLQEVKNHQMLPPHPNCVRYFDSWEEDGYLYIQTELCKMSLNEVLEKCDDHKLPEQLTWDYLMDLLQAVKHLHDHDLIHMDIKPDNIFISHNGVAKLGDFGNMCSCASDEMDVSLFDISSDSGLTDSFDSIDEGDSKYLASETMHGKFTKAADIFSLGISIFEIASGLELPKHGKVYHKLRHNEIEDLYFNGLSADLVRVIKLMMEEDYTKRPTVNELLAMEIERKLSSAKAASLLS